ncbi:hypothetical protein HNR46_002522 [Haloferula luteola]|uniref:AsmA family protein n=2 Tax=Haloferula luteola TaxID=595692 RepID=A0A840VEM2_9BACT|nr:hypothetical protein [Haloferula luteola]
MSRRARKRTERAQPGWIKALLVVGSVALVGMLAAWIGLRHWLHGEEFRHMLEREAGKGLKAEATFGPFRWEGTTVRTPSFSAAGSEIVKRVEADRMSLDIGLSKLRDGVVELRDGRVGRLLVEVEPGAKKEAQHSREGGVPGGETPKKSPRWYDGLTPNEVDLTELIVDESILRVIRPEGAFTLEGTRWRIQPTSSRGAYEATGTGGVLSFPWEKVPSWHLEQAQLRYQEDRVYLNEAVFRLFQRAMLTLSGESNLATGEHAFDGDLRDGDLSEVLPEDWKKRLDGEFEAHMKFKRGPEREVVEGRVNLQNGVLTGLPILDALGAYGGNPRFRRLNLSEASTDFLKMDETLSLKHLVLSSEGLIRVTGDVVIGPHRALRGQIRLGLTPGTLALIPGAETQVFRAGERGLLWTTVQLSGTTDDPHEDLTARLIAAAGLRMFEQLPETGERVLKFTRDAVSPEMLQGLAEHPELLQQGNDLLKRAQRAIDGEGDPIEEATKILRDGADLFDVGKSLFERIREESQEATKPSR